MDLPGDIMTSFHAVSAPGIWNKISHTAYLLSCIPAFAYFMIWCRPKVAGPKIHAFFKALAENEAKDVNVGIAGFCWGGKFVTELCWDEVRTENGKKRLVDCGFIAHPSFLSFPGDVEKVALPLSVAAVEQDRHMKPEDAKFMKETLAAKTATTQVTVAQAGDAAA